MKPMRIRNTAGAIAIAAAVLVMLQPQTARAGDKEWAAAGKILTGLLAAHVIADATCNTPPSRYDVREVRYVAPPPRVVHETRIVKVNPSPSYRSRHYRSYHCAPRTWHSPMRGHGFSRPSWYRESTHVTVQPSCSSTYKYESRHYSTHQSSHHQSYHGSHHGSQHSKTGSLRNDPKGLIIAEDAVIFQTNEWSRVYQPKIHDHPAYRQERSRSGGSWKTVGDHPSIW